MRYDPHSDSWSLFVRDDGAAKWSDPYFGVTTQKGTTTIDSTYTSVALSNFGFYWAYGTAANQSSRFDNFNVQILPLSIVSGLELFLISDSSQADTDHAICFRMLGWARTNLCTSDDWSYSAPVLFLCCAQRQPSI